MTPVRGSTPLCLAIFLFHTRIQPSYMYVMPVNRTNVDATSLPGGCMVYSAPYGREVSCSKVAFDDVLPALWANGTDFTNITITNCYPELPVQLDDNYFLNTTALTNLTITRCYVSDIAPSTFAGLVNLKTLNLQQNTLTVITRGTFEGLSNLKSVYLNGQEGPASLGIIEPGAFSDIKNLEMLDLSYNGQLQLFPNGSNSTSFVEGLTNLSALGLNGVNAYDLPSDEATLIAFLKDQQHSLKELQLRGAHLPNRHLPILRNLKRLRKLDLRGNILGYIQTTSLPELTNAEVYLQHNNIMFVEGGALHRMKNVTIVFADDVDGNPFNCDCNIRDFAIWIRAYGGNISDQGVQVLYAETFRCAGPQDWYEVKLMDYNPDWWDCSPYVPLIALVFIISFLFIIAVIVLVLYCNRVNIRHWMLERRELAIPVPAPPKETGPLLPRVRYINSLRQGKTGAYLIFNYKDAAVNKWANKYLDENLQLHPMKITLQWPAGPEVTPMWKQVKDFSFQVNAFLVIVTDEFLENHWPEIAEKSGIENIMKFVLVLFGKKKRQLPRGLKRLQCPSFEWPTTGSKFTTVERSRDSFWKELRVCLKVLPR